jgi:hypothetical protein
MRPLSCRATRVYSAGVVTIMVACLIGQTALIPCYEQRAMRAVPVGMAEGLAGGRNKLARNRACAAGCSSCRVGGMAGMYYMQRCSWLQVRGSLGWGALYHCTLLCWVATSMMYVKMCRMHAMVGVFGVYGAQGLHNPGPVDTKGFVWLQCLVYGGRQEHWT